MFLPVFDKRFPVVKKQSNAILAFLDVSRRLNSQQLEEVYEQVTFFVKGTKISPQTHF